jgi:hypothetical protein
MTHVSYFCAICNEAPGCFVVNNVLVCNWCADLITDCAAIVPAETRALVYVPDEARMI